MLEIRRSSPGSESMLSRRSYEDIQIAEERGVDMYYDFLKQKKVIEGENYKIEVVPAASLPEELKVYFSDLDQDCFVRTSTPTRNDIAKTITTAVGLDTRTGGQVQVYEDPQFEDETYDMDEAWCRSMGLIWFPALLGVEEQPELAELVARGRQEILDPETLPLVKGSEFGDSKLKAEGYLERLEIAHFSGLLAVYDEVAYPPDGRDYDSVGSLLQHYFDELKSGKNVALRTAARQVRPAKHLFNPERDWKSNTIEKFNTQMYLNYKIGIGGVELLFKEDVAMASEFTTRAAEYLIAQGVATEAAVASASVVDKA